MKFLYLMVGLFVAVSARSEPDNYGMVAGVEVNKIVDGDTIEVTVKEWPPIIGEKIRVRVRGIDTPELKGQCDAERKLAVKAREATELFLNCKSVVLYNLDRGKFFRIVADVSCDGGILSGSLSEFLLNRQLAVEYSGGARTNWCR